MKVKGIVYLGVKTEKFEESNKFFKETLGLENVHFEPGFATYLLPNGDKIEIYGDDDPNKASHEHFVTGPVAGFEVDDIETIRADMEGKGIEFVGPIYNSKTGNSRWSHFKGPDGNIYEIKQLNDAGE